MQHECGWWDVSWGNRQFMTELWSISRWSVHSLRSNSWMLKFKTSHLNSRWSEWHACEHCLGVPDKPHTCHSYSSILVIVLAGQWQAPFATERHCRAIWFHSHAEPLVFQSSVHMNWNEPGTELNLDRFELNFGPSSAIPGISQFMVHPLLAKTVNWVIVEICTTNKLTVAL